MDDYACSSIGEALTINTTLTWLDLSGNKIRDTGAAALARGVACGHGTLTIFDVSDNCIGSSGGLALIQSFLHIMMERNQHRQSISARRKPSIAVTQRTTMRDIRDETENHDDGMPSSMMKTRMRMIDTQRRRRRSTSKDRSIYSWFDLRLCNNNLKNDCVPTILAVFDQALSLHRLEDGHDEPRKWSSSSSIPRCRTIQIDVRGNLIHKDHLEAIAERMKCPDRQELSVTVSRQKATERTSSMSLTHAISSFERANRPNLFEEAKQAVVKAGQQRQERTRAVKRHTQGHDHAAKNVLARLRQDKRSMPLGGYTYVQSHLLKLPTVIPHEQRTLVNTPES
jgi:hypothetical protein